MINAVLQNFLIFCIGTSFLTVGLILLYRHHWMLKLNHFIRDIFLNDAVVLLERRKKAAFFLLAAGVFFAWGYHRVHYSGLRVIDKLVSNDHLLYQSLNHLYDQQFREAATLCKKVLARDPKNTEALYQLAVAQLLRQDIQDGRECWRKAEQINYNPDKSQRFRMLLTKLQDQNHPVTSLLDSTAAK